MSLKNEPIFASLYPASCNPVYPRTLLWVMLDRESADFARESGSGTTCQEGDHAGLAKAVLQLSKTTPDERVEMGRKGRELSQRVFDRGALFSSIEGWIGELCSGAVMSNEQWSRS